MAQNRISIAQARGNFLTWCVSGFMPLAEWCRPLYIGQVLPGSEMEIGTWYIIYSVDQAIELAGPGSILALMAEQHFCACEELPLYITALQEPEGGTAATHVLTVEGPALESGVIAFTILDREFEVPVLEATTADNIATALAAALNAESSLPFSATSSGDAVTMTAKNLGAVGNHLSIQWNPNFGDFLPAGVGITQALGTAGIGVWTNAMVTEVLKVFACPWDCVAAGVENEILNNAIIRAIRANWRCGVQGDWRNGHYFHSFTNSAGQIAAYGFQRNNPEECVIPVRTGYKYPGFLLAAATASRVCCTACWDPSRPVQYDNGILGCLWDSRQCGSIWTNAEKKMFWDAGIVNWDVANARGLRMTNLWIEEPLTTYKWDPNTGARDGAWQRVENRYTITKFVRDLGYWYRRNYSSVSLVNDGTPIPPGKRAVSPRVLQASILAWLRGTQLGWTVEDPGYLERMVKVERTNTPNFCDPNRVNVMIDADLVNQLARIATTIDSSPELSCVPPVLLPNA